MIVDLDSPSTQAVFGGLTGLGQPAVAALVASGILPEGGSLAAWLRTYAVYLRDSLHGRGGAVADARRRLAEAKAAQAELDVAEREGRLACVADIKHWGSVAAGAMANELDGLAMRLAPRLVGVDLDTARRVVDVEQRELRARVLAVVAAWKTPAGTAAAAMVPQFADEAGRE